jgi:hypothetical protein
LGSRGGRKSITYIPTNELLPDNLTPSIGELLVDIAHSYNVSHSTISGLPE